MQQLGNAQRSVTSINETPRTGGHEKFLEAPDCVS